MTPKGLIAIGLVWLAAVVLWVFSFDRSFSPVWMAPSTFKRAALIAGLLLLQLTYVIFMTGWLAPLGLGIYRLTRHR